MFIYIVLQRKTFWKFMWDNSEYEGMHEYTSYKGIDVFPLAW